MRLTDPWFDAEFYGGAFDGRLCTDPDCCVQAQPHHHSGFRRQGATIDGAQGLFLWCPCAYGTDRPHGLIVPFANPRDAPALPSDHGPVSRDGTHPRWTMSGSGLHDLTLTPSIAVGDPECWHGYITNGLVT